MRINWKISTAALAAALMFSGGAQALAATPSSGSLTTAATASATTSAADGPVTIQGGKTQSTDPTKYNYVAPSGGISVQSANGVGYTTAFTYEWRGLNIGIPSGFINHSIVGSSLMISSERAGWQSSTGAPAQICNYQWQFQNRFGETIYSTIKMPVVSSCSVTNSLPDTTHNVTRYLKTGKQCARLFVNGTYRGEQCHNISQN